MSQKGGGRSAKIPTYYFFKLGFSKRERKKNGTFVGKKYDFLLKMSVLFFEVVNFQKGKKKLGAFVGKK